MPPLITSATGNSPLQYTPTKPTDKGRKVPRLYRSKRKTHTEIAMGCFTALHLYTSCSPLQKVISIIPYLHSNFCWLFPEQSSTAFPRSSLEFKMEDYGLTNLALRWNTLSNELKPSQYVKYFISIAYMTSFCYLDYSHECDLAGTCRVKRHYACVSRISDINLLTQRRKCLW